MQNDHKIFKWLIWFMKLEKSMLWTGIDVIFTWSCQFSQLMRSLISDPFTSVNHKMSIWRKHWNFDSWHIFEMLNGIVSVDFQNLWAWNILKVLFDSGLMKSSNVYSVKMSPQIYHRSWNLILFPLYWLNIFLICGIRCYVVCFLCLFVLFFLFLFFLLFVF